MPNDPSSSAAELADREIVSTRMIEAPRERVFRAYTDPTPLAQWWGPKGFTNTFETFDLRPDGEWRFVMHGPDGKDYPNRSLFRQIVPPERLIIDHVSPPQFRMTITFAVEGSGTRVTFRMHFATSAARDAIKGLVVPANEENFDRLEAVLATMA